MPPAQTARQRKPSRSGSPHSPQGGGLKEPRAPRVWPRLLTVMIIVALAALVVCSAAASQAALAAAEARAAEALAAAEARAEARATAQAEALAAAEARAEARATAQTEALAAAEARAEARANAQAETLAAAEARAEARANAQAEALAAAEARAEARATAQAETLAAAEARAEARANAQAEALAVADARATAQAEALTAADARATTQAKALSAAEARAESPDEARKTAHRAYLAAEAWRHEEAEILYANMTDADWDTAARWKSYAHPDAPERTCASALSQELLVDILRLRRVVAGLPALSNHSRSAYLALHAFHSTGLEGNTLTLPETLLTIAGQPLLGGFDRRVLPSPAQALSAIEALNVAQLWDALDLASLSDRRAPPLDLAALSEKALVDLNSAITRGTGTPPGLRQRAVAIGHQRVLLPMPDEVPVLVREFLGWLAASLGATAAPAPNGGEGESTSELERALALACDAHTRFVFVHPFADGNGRTARTLAGLVLQRLGLPAPMFSREQRSEYMAAVSAATGGSDYAPLAAMHAAAVRRALACQLLLSGAEAAALDTADAEAFARGACTFGEATWRSAAMP